MSPSHVPFLAYFLIQNLVVWWSIYHFYHSASQASKCYFEDPPLGLPSGSSSEKSKWRLSRYKVDSGRLVIVGVGSCGTSVSTDKPDVDTGAGA